MSRTYRKGVEWKYKMHGHYYEQPSVRSGWRAWLAFHGICLVQLWTKKARDGKKHNGLMTSPPVPWAKRIQARHERRHQNWAVRDGKEFIPVFKKTVRWDYW